MTIRVRYRRKRSLAWHYSDPLTWSAALKLAAKYAKAGMESECVES